MGNILKAGVFNVDVTPEIGGPIAFGINKKTDSPIFIRGVIIDDSKKRIVLASCDFLYIWGNAYEQMKKVIAKAAGTVPQKVLLHSVHQHDSINIAIELNDIHKKYIGIEVTPLAYYKKINEDMENAVAKAVRKMKTVKNLASAERRISGLASNRRLLDKNGKVHAMRWSMCHNPELQSEATGVIDPMLRSIAFIGGNDKPLAVMHFYASHPMTAYGRNMCSADVPGVALEYVKKHYDENVSHIYFTGCGGNITFGKYSLENKEKSLKFLGKRLGKEILENCRQLEKKKIGSIALKNSSFELPLKAELNEKKLLEKIEKTEDRHVLILLSTLLETVRNWEKWKNLNITRLSIGEDIHILSLPSETVIEYQLYAQELVPEKFLACAAYANSSYGYIPTAKMYSEGGYEPGGASITTIDAEAAMKKAIYETLQNLR